MAHDKLPNGCKLIEVPSVVDQRGTLSFATSGKEIPFPIARMFWIYDVPEHQKRGGHAHRECAEVVFALSGAVTFVVDDGRERQEVRLARPTQGLLIEAWVWCELLDFAPNTIIAVAASHPYDGEGYIHDYEQYRKERKK